MDWLANGQTTRVEIMSRFEQQNVHEHNDELASFGREFAYQDDLTMEQILENLNHTPLGQVLKRIASMPEVRRKKVLEVRRSLSTGQYELNERLDRALEKVFEDLKT
jgi:hypothetical protein